MDTTKQYRIIIIPPNSYDTVKTLSYKTEKERKQWFKYHANNPTISNCQIILEEGKQWNS